MLTVVEDTAHPFRPDRRAGEIPCCVCGLPWGAAVHHRQQSEQQTPKPPPRP